MCGTTILCHPLTMLMMLLYQEDLKSCPLKVLALIDQQAKLTKAMSLSHPQYTPFKQSTYLSPKDKLAMTTWIMVLHSYPTQNLYDPYQQIAPYVKMSGCPTYKHFPSYPKNHLHQCQNRGAHNRDLSLYHPGSPRLSVYTHPSRAIRKLHRSYVDLIVHTP